MTKLDIHLPHCSYPIIIGRELLDGGLLAQFCPGGRAALVTDENVWRLHGQRMEEMLEKAGIQFVRVVLPPGEGSKTTATLELLWRTFAEAGLGRHDPVIAFGGGVVGDVAGFAAATWMRGAPLVQVPTTLLAQVDSSVGGKTAVNLPQGKNLVGCFYQPRAVLAELSVLDTLTERELRAGMAEVIKYAAIGQSELLDLLEKGDIEREMERAVALCCGAKSEFVTRDERDTGARMTLNFGHTFGHALEKIYNFSRYNHGEAVAVGMMLAVRVGVLMGQTSPETPERLGRMLEAAGLDGRWDGDPLTLAPHMAGDKKNSGGKITLILLRELGHPFTREVTPRELEDILGGLKSG